MSYIFKQKTYEKNQAFKNVMAMGLAPVSNKEALGLVSLEPRILLDAAGFVTGAEVAMDALASEDAQLGVEGIFDGTAAVTTEASENEAQRSELMDSLAFAEQDMPEDDLAAAPRGIIYLRDGSPAPESEETDSAAPRGIIYLADGTPVPENEETDSAAPRGIIYLADGKPAPESEETDSAAPRGIIYLADGTPAPENEETDSAAPRGIIYLADGTPAPENEETDSAAPRGIIYLADGTPAPESEETDSAAPRGIIYLRDGTPVPDNVNEASSQTLMLDEQLTLEASQMDAGSNELMRALSA